MSRKNGKRFVKNTIIPKPHLRKRRKNQRKQRMMKAEMDLKFLLECRDKKLFPTHVKWKILQKMKPRDRHRHHERNLKESITTMSEKNTRKQKLIFVKQ